MCLLIPDACMSAVMGFTVGVWVMFCVVISPVLSSSVPVVAKLVLRCTAREPLEAHIHHFSPARDISIVGNSFSCGVISLDRAFWLGPPHADEGLAMGYHFSCRDEMRSKFRFCRRCHNKFDDLGNRENITVEYREGVILLEDLS
jgi:hypothetical protein